MPYNFIMDISKMRVQFYDDTYISCSIFIFTRQDRVTMLRVVNCRETQIKQAACVARGAYMTVLLLMFITKIVIEWFTCSVTYLIVKNNWMEFSRVVDYAVYARINERVCQLELHGMADSWPWKAVAKFGLSRNSAVLTPLSSSFMQRW